MHSAYLYINEVGRRQETYTHAVLKRIFQGILNFLYPGNQGPLEASRGFTARRLYTGYMLYVTIGKSNEHLLQEQGRCQHIRSKIRGVHHKQQYGRGRLAGEKKSANDRTKSFPQVTTKVLVLMC